MGGTGAARILLPSNWDLKGGTPVGGKQDRMVVMVRDILGLGPELCGAGSRPWGYEASEAQGREAPGGELFDS